MLLSPRAQKTPERTNRPKGTGANVCQQDMMRTVDSTGALAAGLLTKTSTNGGLIIKKNQDGVIG